MNAEHADINGKNMGICGTRLSLQKVLLISGIFIVDLAFGQNLEGHQWQHRVLIIKTNAKDSNTYLQQIEEFKNLEEQMKERKLVVYSIVKKEYVLINFEHTTPYSSGIISKEVEKKLDPGETFEVLLVGLDGQTKLRKTELLSKADLFAIIDAMPMRRSEMCHKKG